MVKISFKFVPKLFKDLFEDILLVKSEKNMMRSDIRLAGNVAKLFLVSTHTAISLII